MTSALLIECKEIRCYHAKTYFLYEKLEQRGHPDSNLILSKKQSPDFKKKERIWSSLQHEYEDQVVGRGVSIPVILQCFTQSRAVV